MKAIWSTQGSLSYLKIDRSLKMSENHNGGSEILASA